MFIYIYNYNQITLLIHALSEKRRIIVKKNLKSVATLFTSFWFISSFEVNFNSAAMNDMSFKINELIENVDNINMYTGTSLDNDKFERLKDKNVFIIFSNGNWVIVNEDLTTFKFGDEPLENQDKIYYTLSREHVEKNLIPKHILQKIIEEMNIGYQQIYKVPNDNLKSLILLINNNQISILYYSPSSSDNRWNQQLINEKTNTDRIYTFPTENLSNLNSINDEKTNIFVRGWYENNKEKLKIFFPPEMDFDTMD